MGREGGEKGGGRRDEKWGRGKRKGAGGGEG